MMHSVEEPEPKGVFECRLCGLRAPYSYHGQKPPNACSVVLLEECYTMNDPFAPQRDRFLILGSHCCLCNNAVCVGQKGHLFCCAHLQDVTGTIRDSLHSKLVVNFIPIAPRKGMLEHRHRQSLFR
ncbi:cysteine-rich DPF motif domain-containing protein 1 isoform X2 [Mustelus asterias]